MLPGKIVGSLVGGGSCRPFVLDVPTGNVTTGKFVEADPHQKNIGKSELAAIEKQVRSQVPGASEVRVGSFQCPKCGRWVDVARSPDDWSDDTCAGCA